MEDQIYGSPLPIPPLDDDDILAGINYSGDDGFDFDFIFDDVPFDDDLLFEPQLLVSDDFENNSNPRVEDCSSSEPNQGAISFEDSSSCEEFRCKSNSRVLYSDHDVSLSSFFDNLSENGKSMSMRKKEEEEADRPPVSDDFDDNRHPRVDDCLSYGANQGAISFEESNSCEKLSNYGVLQASRGDPGNSSDHDVSSSSFVDNLSDNRKINAEEMLGSQFSLSKRKKDQQEGHAEGNGERINKYRRSEGGKFNVGSDEDEKRKARLIRNRESAQISRQRKKQYVEELEGKVRSMHSTITELNSKISYVMAENASLRQQLGCGATLPPPPGVHPMAPMPHPWVSCPPYVVRPQGVPLVPIPRLKPQPPAPPAPKVNKKSKRKKSEGKLKKVASVSFLGLLFFVLLFGGLVPMVNVRYGGTGNGYDDLQKRMVFMVDKHGLGTSNGNFSHGRILQQLSISDRFNPVGNASEPLVASLYVPRNDKLVKIDGNLIIHSVVTSEKAMASQMAEGVKTSEETSLAIHGSYPPYPIAGPGSNYWRHLNLDGNQNGRQRALGSGFFDDFKPVVSNVELQQWFHEALAGPVLSSGMCTEVFQFDVSPAPGAIVPATSNTNVTSEHHQYSTCHNRPRNRRILHEHAIPLEHHTLNATKEHMPLEQNNGLQSNKSRSSMVVSVFVDPREAGDGDGESVIGSKTLSQIFVVVLIDSVKYVTYSCRLPFMGSGNHLMTT